MVRLMAVFFVVAALGAACGKSNKGGGTVKIEFMGALSGDYKLLVEPGFEAAKLAFDQANASGDLDVKVVLEAQDTQGDPTQATSIANKIVSDDAVVGVIGPAFSGESGAVGDTLDQAGIPFVTQSATDDALSTHGWTHWFRALGNNSSQAVPEAQYIAQITKPNCAVVAQDGSAYGKGLAEIAAKTLTDSGVDVSSQEQVDPNSKDFSALVAKVQSSGCKALSYGGYSPQAGPIRKQLTQAGLSDVQMVAGDGIKDDAFLQLAGDAGEGTIAGCGCAEINNSDDPDAKKFVADFTAATGDAPGIYAAEGWDVAQIFIAAMKDGNTDRASITDFIANLSGFKGLTKTYSFQDNGELDEAAVVTFFYKDTGGEWVVQGPSTDILTG